MLLKEPLPDFVNKERSKEHNVPSTTIKYFTYQHLPAGPMQITSIKCFELASAMEAMLPDGPEKSAGMRKLLEAKDCFVRASMDIKGEEDVR